MNKSGAGDRLAHELALPRQRRAWLQLTVAAMVLLGCWGFLLPRLRQVPEIDRHVSQMQEAKIDAGAMFYTELNWNAPPGWVFR